MVLKVWQNFPNLHQKNKFKNICSHSGNPPPQTLVLMVWPGFKGKPLPKCLKRDFKLCFWYSVHYHILNSWYFWVQLFDLICTIYCGQAPSLNYFELCIYVKALGPLAGNTHLKLNQYLFALSESFTQLTCNFLKWFYYQH